MTSHQLNLGSPVEPIDTKSSLDTIQEGMALCLSGGGYRAMLFHIGSLWRLNDFGFLPKLERISSVSGGSITSAVLGMNWKKLTFNSTGQGSNFEESIVKPIRNLADKTIDLKSIFTGILTPGSVSEKLVAVYDKHLFKGKTLQDLPDDPPRFVINATNVQSGALWRFMKPYMRDWRVGEVKKPKIPLAVAVAASSAFPPVLSPAELELNPDDFTNNSGYDLHNKPYTSTVYLSDGGIYDNLGLETAWKRYKTILVSDAGGKLEDNPDPKLDWVGHTVRVLNIIDNQVRSLRKRQLIESFEQKERLGAYWGIRTDIRNYNLSNALVCPFTNTTQLANIQTRLKRLDSITQEKLINWGYAVCDAAIRKHLQQNLHSPNNFPYPNSGV